MYYIVFGHLYVHINLKSNSVEAKVQPMLTWQQLKLLLARKSVLANC